MNKAILIRKELLPNNFKLIFKSSENAQFLILHKEHKKTYNQLEINQEYFYTWKKGKKNYCFINPYSIKKNTKKNEQTSKKQQPETPRFFVQQLIKDLKLKGITEEEFFNKIECLKCEFKTIKLKNNLDFVFKWIKEFITTIYLKHNKLEKETIKHNYTKQEQKEQEFLAEIGAIFLQDWIYYQNKRDNKYKSKLLLDSPVGFTKSG